MSGSGGGSGEKERRPAEQRDADRRDEGWLSPDEDRVWRSYVDAQVRFWRKLAQLLHQDTGLSEPDFAILRALHESPGGQLRPYQLSGVTQFEKSRLHHQLTRMAGRGLITREPCPDASRGALIALTGRGRTAITDALPRRAAHIREWLITPVGPDRLAALGQISEAILAELATDDDAPAPPPDQAVDANSDASPGPDPGPEATPDPTPDPATSCTEG